MKPGCRRVVTNYEGDVMDESIISYSKLVPVAGMRLMVWALTTDLIGIYRVGKGGALSLLSGDLVSGDCVVMEMCK